jgi:hypothetical protein
VTLTAPGYTDARGQSRDPGTTTLTFNAQGRLLQSKRSGAGGGTTTFGYHTSGAGHGLLQSIVGPAAGSALALTYTCDDLGRLSAVTRGFTGGQRQTSVVVDTHGRTESIAVATAGGPQLKGELYYDEFGEVSWSRSENRDENGNFRTRPWIQSVTARDRVGRPVNRFQDSALGAELHWVFDGLGDVRARTEKGVLGGLITTTTEIDYVTGLVTRTDAENRVSRFYHDKAWRLDNQELPGAVAGSHPLATTSFTTPPAG